MNKVSLLKVCKYIILTALSLTISGLSLAENAHHDLLKRLNAINNFESQYEQTIHDKTNHLVEEARGKFFLGSNKSFKNTIDYPDKSAMISDGKKLWMIDYDLEQASVSYLDAYLSGSPLALLLGDAKQSLDGFNIKKTENNQLKQTIYLLTAKDTLTSISEIRLGFKNS